MYDTMLSTYNAVLTALPSVIGTLLQANDAATTAQKAFLAEWPELDNKQAEPAVKAAVQAYRAANPRATVDEIIKNAGVMAMINLGKDPTRKAAAEAKPTPKPKPKPAKPAAPTGQTPVPPKPKGDQEDNVFAELAELFTNEMG